MQKRGLFLFAVILLTFISASIVSSQITSRTEANSRFCQELVSMQTVGGQPINEYTSPRLRIIWSPGGSIYNDCCRVFPEFCSQRTTATTTTSQKYSTIEGQKSYDSVTSCLKESGTANNCEAYTKLLQEAYQEFNQCLNSCSSDAQCDLCGGSLDEVYNARTDALKDWEEQVRSAEIETKLPEIKSPTKVCPVGFKGCCDPNYALDAGKCCGIYTKENYYKDDTRCRQRNYCEDEEGGYIIDCCEKDPEVCKPETESSEVYNTGALPIEFNYLSERALPASSKPSEITDSEGRSIPAQDLEKSLTVSKVKITSQLENVRKGQPFFQEIHESAFLSKAVFVPSQDIARGEMVFTLNEKPKDLRIADPEPTKYETVSVFGLEFTANNQEIQPLSQALFYIRQPGGTLLKYDPKIKDWAELNKEEVYDRASNKATGFIAKSPSNSYFAVVVEKEPSYFSTEVIYTITGLVFWALVFYGVYRLYKKFRKKRK